MELGKVLERRPSSPRASPGCWLGWRSCRRQVSDPGDHQSRPEQVHLPPPGGDHPAEGTPELPSSLPLRVGGRARVFSLSNPHLPPLCSQGPLLKAANKNHRAPQSSIAFNASHRGTTRAYLRRTLLYPRYPLDGPPRSKKLSLKTRQQLPLPGPTFHILTLRFF